ncbi:thymidylate kinase-domain-containing protein [Glomus cerebriforme]|uniref:Thymidylate kinase-domain-containing protein n=1 Tax=Glomus cerebriforme TaxID=658196 RepID=A0A397SFD6_9GLOM|nr:thymidylate kinase-domain-containing protein [Glomus cerebriforme]
MESREPQRFQGKSVIIIEGGSKELKDRNVNNNSRKPSPTEAIKAKLGTPTPQLSTYSSSSHGAQRLPPPCTLVPPQLQSLPSSQQPQAIILPTTPSSSSSSTVSGSPCGALIVLEGCEDSTSLQSKQLYEFLKNEGIKARLWKFPDTSTPSGSALKTYQSTNRQLHPKTLHLLVAAHWWELMPTMKEHLMNGITLIVDRYVYSAMAESAAAGLDLLWCKYSYLQVLSPDLIFFLNVERDVSEIDKQLSQFSLAHVNGNNDSDDTKEWQRRIQDALARLAESQWKVLDARKSNNIINAQIITASIEVIERCRKSNTSYGNMFNNTITSHQNQQLPPLVNSSPPSNHSLPHQQQQNSNVLPPIVRHDGFSRPVHVQL